MDQQSLATKIAFADIALASFLPPITVLLAGGNKKLVTKTLFYGFIAGIVLFPIARKIAMYKR